MPVTYEVQLKPILEAPDEHIPFDGKVEGRVLARKSVGSDKISTIPSIGTGDISDNAITKAKMADDSVAQNELDYEQVTVTVTAGNPSGTATVTSGSIVIGWRATGNQDQFIDNISISGTTLTITLAANATANNTFEVTLLKP